MSKSWSHFTRTRRRAVCVCPAGLDPLAVRPTDLRQVIQGEASLALRTMRREVELWNNRPQIQLVRVYLERGRVSRYAPLEIFRPLASDIIGYDEIVDLGLPQYRKSNVIHVCISDGRSISDELMIGR